MKKKSSRNNHHAENKENIDIEELEAETARIHREMLSGVGEKTNMDSSRGGGHSKRTVSDNARSHTDQRMATTSGQGIKVLMDKTNNLGAHLGPSGNSFVIKRPITQMTTERATNISAICN